MDMILFMFVQNSGHTLHITLLSHINIYSGQFIFLEVAADILKYGHAIIY